MNIALCLIIKNENPYLLEWLKHHYDLGIRKFFIYDNKSENSVSEYLYRAEKWFEKLETTKNSFIPILNCVETILWENENFLSQSNAYLDCCQKHSEYDYIGFIDTDEFIMTKDNISIENMLQKITELHGNFVGLGMYWRMYGKKAPYFESRQYYTEYKEYSDNSHIKSFINPKHLFNFPDPHKAAILGRYIDELGREVVSPLGEHTSKLIWIKHIWTRSLSEWENKVKRLDANTRQKTLTFERFYNHNDNLDKHD